MNFLAAYDLGLWQWTALILSGLLIGVSKTGVSGILAIIVPVMALIFGARESTGIILPMLCFADIPAVFYYRRSAEWKYVGKLLPWALAGFALALAVDRMVPARLFKFLIGLCILAGLAVMFWNDRRNAKTTVPSAWWFSAAFGILGGFSTMIGNAAGPIMSVFLLSMRLPKRTFVGTGAWFFMIINFLKLPIQYFIWRNISREGLILNALLIPVIIAGAALGILLVKIISEKQYRNLIYTLTLLSTALLFV